MRFKVHDEADDYSVKHLIKVFQLESVDQVEVSQDPVTYLGVGHETTIRTMATLGSRRGTVRKKRAPLSELSPNPPGPGRPPMQRGHSAAETVRSKNS